MAEKHPSRPGSVDIVTRVLRNTAINWIARVGSGAALFFFYVLLARYLGDVGFGKYSFALAVAGLFGIVADFGFSTFLTREVAREPGRAQEFLSGVLVAFIVFSAFCLVGVVVTAFAGTHEADTRAAIVMLGGAILCHSGIIFLSGIFRGFQKMEYEALASSSNRIFISLLGLGFIYARRGLVEISFAVLLGALLSLLFTVWLVQSRFVKIRARLPGKDVLIMLGSVLPLGLAVLFSTVTMRVDKIFLAFFRGNAEVGWYSAPDKLLEALLFIPSFFTFAMFPVYSEFFKKSREHLASAFFKSCKFLLIIGLPIAVGSSVFSREIVALFFGPNFAPSGAVLSILIWAFVLVSLNGVLYYLLVSMEEQVRALYACGIGAAALVALDILLIPHFGAVGAAFACVAARLIYLTLNLIYLSRRLTIRPIWLDWTKLSASALIMLGLCILVGRLNLFYGLTAGIIGFVGSLVLFRVFSAGELAVMREVIRGYFPSGGSRK